MSKKIQKYKLVEFDKSTCNHDDYNKYFKATFEGKQFVFIGEVEHRQGHCFLADLDTGKIIGMYHTVNFKEVK